MNSIGPYRQVTEFTTENAGTSEWCRAERDGRPYFVKKLVSPVWPPEDLALSAERREARIRRFNERVQALRSQYEALRHSDTAGLLVVPLDVLTVDCHICTVAPFVTGNLRAEDTAGLRPDQKLALMRALTQALVSVHRAGLVHSDLKPDNLIMTQTDDGACSLQLIDFDGSFPQASPPAVPSDVHGDPLYFAPEAYRFSMGAPEPLGPGLDVFALGLLLHLMWTGSLPACPENMTPGEAVARGVEPVLQRAIPPQLRSLIARTLSPAAADRPSMQEIDSLLVKMTQEWEEWNRVPRAAVRVECSTREGRILRSWALQIPYGGEETVRAPEIPGMRPESWSRKVTVRVGEDGRFRNPVVLDYRRAGRGGRSAVIAGTAAGIAVLVMILIFALWLGPKISASCTADNTPAPLTAVPVMTEAPTPAPTRTRAPTAMPAATLSPKEAAERTGIRGLWEGGTASLTLRAGEAAYVRFTPGTADDYILTFEWQPRDLIIDSYRCDANWRTLGSHRLRADDPTIVVRLSAGEACCLRLSIGDGGPASVRVTAERFDRITY